MRYKNSLSIFQISNKAGNISSLKIFVIPSSTVLWSLVAIAAITGIDSIEIAEIYEKYMTIFLRI
jgi:hypothetical protein